MARRPFSEVAESLPREPVRPSGSCSAYGCPLGGFIFDNPKDTEGWCDLHNMHREKDLPRLTRAIRARQHVMKAARKMLADGDQVRWWRGEHFQELEALYENHADLLPTTEERNGMIHQWYSRVLRAIERDCLAEIGIHLPQEKPREKKEFKRPLEQTKEQREAQLAAEEELRAMAGGSVMGYLDGPI